MLLLLPVVLFAAGDISRIDSLEASLSVLDEKEQISTLQELLSLYIDKNPHKSIEYGKKAISLAEKYNRISDQCKLLISVGVAYEYQSNYLKALELYNKSLDLANSIDSKEDVVNALYNLSLVNADLNKYDVSLNYCLQALDIYHELNDQAGIAYSLNNIGNIYLYLEQYDKALQYYLNSIDVKLDSGQKESLSSNYHNIALIYQALGKYSEAIHYYNLALSELQKENDQYKMAVCYGNLSSLYILLEDYKKAYSFNLESLHIFESMGNNEGICSAKTTMADILIKMKDFEQAHRFLVESMQLAMQEINKPLISSNYKSISDYYQARNDHVRALEYYKKYHALNDSINEETNNKQLTELSVQYEAAQREKEIALLKKEDQSSNQVRNILIYTLVLGLVFILFLLYLYYDKIKDGKIRQEIQEKLKDSESLYRTLTENIRVGVYTYNSEGRFTYVNPASCKITGYSEEELLKMRFFDVVHSNYLDMVMKNGLSRIRGEVVPTDYEFRITTKTGEERWIENSSVRISISNVIMVLGTSIEVTDRHLAHLKLQESEAQMRALFTAMDDVIFTMDREGKYLTVAPSSPGQWYRPPQSLVGKRIHDFYPKEQADFFLQQVNNCLKNREMVVFDFDMKIDDKALFFDAKITPLNNSSVLMVARNITERKQSIRKLIESEEKYRNLVESIEEGLAIVDNDMNFVFVNNAACRIYGYSSQELLRMNVMDLVPADHQTVITEQHQNRLQGFKTTYENWNRHEDGALRLIKASAGPLFKDDQIIGTISLFSDITEMRAAEEKIQASLAEKEVLLQEIYHRVKNNMQIISSMLKLQSLHINKENAIEVFKNCQNRVKSMSLIHEKLYRSHDLSHISAHDYFSSLIKQLFMSYHTPDVKITYTLDCDKDLNLDINTAIPCGIIANELITNSLKHAFSEAGGNIFLSFSRVDNERYLLLIGNDGNDFPEDADPERATSFGLQLVEILRKQLHADFVLDRKKGVKFIFTFTDLNK